VLALVWSKQKDKNSSVAVFSALFARSLQRSAKLERHRRRRPPHHDRRIAGRKKTSAAAVVAVKKRCGTLRRRRRGRNGIRER